MGSYVAIGESDSPNYISTLGESLENARGSDGQPEGVVAPPMGVHRTPPAANKRIYAANAQVSGDINAGLSHV